LNFTIDDIKKSKVADKNLHLFTEDGKTLLKKHKYSAERTEVNGKTFPSKKEAKRYAELLLLLKSGEIVLLELQVPFELNEGGTHSLKYIADFVYVDVKTGQKIIEDAKGFKTKEYKKKKRLMLKVHNIKIHEV
jgi:hypothetical protein